MKIKAKNAHCCSEGCHEYRTPFVRKRQPCPQNSYDWIVIETTKKGRVH